jgi:hypothetical protein
MFKIRFPHPLTFLRRRTPARTSLRPPRVTPPLLPALWAPPAPRLVPAVVEADKEPSRPKSGFVL